MDTTVQTKAWREFAVVVAMAVAGVVLASLVAFVPWHPGGVEQRRPAVVQVHAPGLVGGQAAGVTVRSR